MAKKKKGDQDNVLLKKDGSTGFTALLFAKAPNTVF
jgi:hypothetical protein